MESLSQLSWEKLYKQEYGSCLRKVAYKNLSMCMNAIEKQPDKVLFPYHCNFCDKYHTTSMVPCKPKSAYQPQVDLNAMAGALSVSQPIAWHAVSKSLIPVNIVKRKEITKLIKSTVSEKIKKF